MDIRITNSSLKVTASELVDISSDLEQEDKSLAEIIGSNEAEIREGERPGTS